MWVMLIKIMEWAKILHFIETSRELKTFPRKQYMIINIEYIIIFYYFRYSCE